MALKTQRVIIESGRDAGKVFLITEMPLTQADRWANRVLCASASGGIGLQNVDFAKIMDVVSKESKDDAVESGREIDVVGGILEMATLSISALGNIPADTAQELLEELIDKCVTAVPTGGLPREMLDIDDEIEDLKTLWELRRAAFSLHIDFLTAGSSPDSAT